MEFQPFKIVKVHNSDKPQIQITYKNKERKYYPENIISMILPDLKIKASDFLEKEVKNAIISVPNSFNTIQREEIEDVARNAGLNIIRFINPSTTAGIAYAFDKKINDEKNYLIFDLGGGTLNISVIIGYENGLYEVRSVNGNQNLGGEDFNYRFLEYCLREFRRKTSIDLKNFLKQ